MSFLTKIIYSTSTRRMIRESVLIQAVMSTWKLQIICLYCGEERIKKCVLSVRKKMKKTERDGKGDVSFFAFVVLSSLICWLDGGFVLFPFIHMELFYFHAYPSNPIVVLNVMNIAYAANCITANKAEEHANILASISNNNKKILPYTYYFVKPLLILIYATFNLYCKNKSQEFSPICARYPSCFTSIPSSMPNSFEEDKKKQTNA